VVVVVVVVNLLANRDRCAGMRTYYFPKPVGNVQLLFYQAAALSVLLKYAGTEKRNKLLLLLLVHSTSAD
jgi:hypothetical protein